jgi:hypothetical protein
MGYQSMDGNNKWPAGDPTGQASPIDLGEQNDGYQAVFAAWSRKPWLQGIFWWHWSPNPNEGGGNNNWYTPQDKPAEETIKAMYGGESVRTFYDFESGVQNWAADFSEFFINNLSTPTTASQGGSSALRYPLDLNVKADDGKIKDFAYIQPALTKDLSGYKGLKARVMVPAGVSIDPQAPLSVALVVKTGETFDWYQSNTFRNLTPGQWREISIDFASAEAFPPGDAGLGRPVLNTNDIRQIGISLAGAGGASRGNTVFWVDDVAVRGANGNILGVSVSARSLSFGTQAGLSNVALGSPLEIENTGNVNVRYSLQCSSSTPGQWGPSSTAPGPGTFVLNAQFNSAKPAGFTEANHAVGLISTASDPSRFAGDETGTTVAPFDVRRLWLQLRTPQVVTESDRNPQTINLRISAEIQ